jgi:hypothetical protein
MDACRYMLLDHLNKLQVVNEALRVDSVQLTHDMGLIKRDLFPALKRKEQ